MELLVGAPEFWARAKSDIATATRRVLLQAMSFEGDAAGHSVADALLSSTAADRRVLVDGYTRVNINDRQVGSFAAKRDLELQAEVAATDAMFRKLVASHIPVRVTNPIRSFGLNYPARNHKKLIVSDDVTYIGGVNFSDHNFDWPDLMLRIESAEAADFLALDFLATFHGCPRSASKNISGIRLLALDGRANAQGFREIFYHIASAQHNITVFSPYLTRPFTDLLGKASRRGVSVRLFTPWPNNKLIVRDAMLNGAARYGFEVVLNPIMSHLKGMLIDGNCLVLGSSNFDFASLAAEEEFLAIIDDPAIIRDFTRRVIDPALVTAAYPGALRTRWKGWAPEILLRIAAVVATAASRSHRSAVDWPG